MPPDRGSRPRSFLVVAAAYASALVAAAALCTLASRLPPVLSALCADLAATLVVFAFSRTFDNSSIYDPYWSVAPVPIALYWLARSGQGIGTRQLVVLVLLSAWAMRLTVNWALRWKGLADEDWRYKERRQGGVPYWPLSLAGFHLMPTVLVFLGCLPLLPVLADASARVTGVIDLAAALVTAGAIVVEAASDAQLRRFLRSPRTAGQVLDTGLWAFSRHPNYFGEVAFWWGLWLFGLAADPSRWWTVVGPAAITGLFLGVSVPMMDRRMLSRHPGYGAHVMSRSAFLPWPPRKNADGGRA